MYDRNTKYCFAILSTATTLAVTATSRRIRAITKGRPKNSSRLKSRPRRKPMPDADQKPSGTPIWLWPLIAVLAIVAIGLYYWTGERAKMAPPVAQTPPVTPAPAPVAQTSPATPAPAPVAQTPPATPSPSPVAQTPPATPAPSPLAQTPPATPAPSPLAQTPPATPAPSPLAQTPPATPAPSPLAQTPPALSFARAGGGRCPRHRAAEARAQQRGRRRSRHGSGP